MTKKTLKKSFFFYSDVSNLKITVNSLEHGYLLILDNDLINAKQVFAKLDSPRAHWGVILCSILEGYIEIYPTYFQLRNFLEIDLDFLIKNEKIDYVEQLLGAVKIFSTINQEIFKYVARVMIENNLTQLAYHYLENSKQLHYRDPELLFMLSKFHLENKNFYEANYYINECLKILPEYYPAKLIKTKIDELTN